MFRSPEVYKVGIAVAPVPDQKLYDTIYQERYMGLPDANAEGYRKGSAIHFAAGLEGAGYRVLNEVALNQVLVSFGDAAATERVVAGIQSDGTCWCGGTVWQGQSAMRISVSSWATTDDDVEQSLAAMIRIARERA